MGQARENPWTTIAMQAIASEAVLAPPGPDGPNMFRCAAPGYVSSLYQAAGLRDVAEWDVGVELVTRSPAQYWEMISEHVSLVVAALQQVGEPAREQIARAVIARASTYEEDGRVRIPGVAAASPARSRDARTGASARTRSSMAARVFTRVVRVASWALLNGVICPGVGLWVAPIVTWLLDRFGPIQLSGLSNLMLAMTQIPMARNAAKDLDQAMRPDSRAVHGYPVV
jgi:hypothetical protein